MTPFTPLAVGGALFSFMVAVSMYFGLPVARDKRLILASAAMMIFATYQFFITVFPEIFK
jgi:hypothetical protein